MSTLPRSTPIDGSPVLTTEQFDALLVAALPRLRGFARAYCGSPSDADDAVQITCERALERWPQWSGRGPVEHWLVKILVNVWRDELRTRKRHTVPESASVSECSDGHADASDELFLIQVQTAIMHLPQGQREVLLLIAGEGMSYCQAAQSLGIPVGTVMSRLCRARQTLIAKFGKQDGRA